MKPTEEYLQKQMKALSCTREEAIALWEYDQDVDHDRPTPYDPTEEQKKNTQAVRKSLNKGPREKKTDVKRERKIDTDKLALINLLAQALTDNSITVEEIKTETEIKFTYLENSYVVKLTKHRSEKVK